MIKAELTLGEIAQLSVELNGSAGVTGIEGTAFKGLLNQSLPINKKYWLGKLAKTALDTANHIGKLRDELITKLGTENPKGQPEIQPMIVKLGKNKNPELDGKGNKIMIPNPVMELFGKEMNDLLEIKKEITFPPFCIDDYTMSADEYYHVFFKLVDLSETQEPELV